MERRNLGAHEYGEWQYIVFYCITHDQVSHVFSSFGRMPPIPVPSVMPHCLALWIRTVCFDLDLSDKFCIAISSVLVFHCILSPRLPCYCGYRYQNIQRMASVDTISERALSPPRHHAPPPPPPLPLPASSTSGAPPTATEASQPSQPAAPAPPISQAGPAPPDSEPSLSLSLSLSVIFTYWDHCFLLKILTPVMLTKYVHAAYYGWMFANEKTTPRLRGWFTYVSGLGISDQVSMQTFLFQQTSSYLENYQISHEHVL